MLKWDEEKAAFIDKLETTAHIFADILKTDPNHMIVSPEERKNIHNLMDRNKCVLDKLKNKEFTVAVVGLEKSGKSTLANALIKLIVLPEYTERCTYTTTEIRAGNEELAEVFFYTREEFDRHFKSMLEEIRYPNPIGFSEISADAFNNYWSAIEEKTDSDSQNLFQRHNGTTVEDIKSIIEGKELIQQYLGHEPMVFQGETELRQMEFQKFITGIVGYEQGLAIRKPYPYAVENVKIRSTMLGNMKNIVLRDVPGFDSPTELHKKQTEEMLKQADAVILVTNAGNHPNLTSTQLDMLRKGRDDDGIKLSEKAFVFGNKLDRADNEQKAKDNCSALCRDAVGRFKIATNARVICGSAKAYLEANGLESEDDKRRGGGNVKEILAGWKLSDGIDELRQKLVDYYDNDRFTVLQRRAERIICEIEDYFRSIVERYTPEKMRELEIEGYDHLLAAADALAKFSEIAHDISDRCQQEIQKNKPFSNELLNGIEDIFPSISESDERVIRAGKKTSSDADGVFRLSQFVPELRKDLQIECSENIMCKTTTMTRANEQAIMDELADAFLGIIGMKHDSPYKEELFESVQALFNEILEKTGGSQCHFNSLIERFSRSVIEVLIGCSFAHQERLDKIIKNQDTLDEFLALSAYYKDSDNPDDSSRPFYQSDMFKKILLHQDFAADAAANETVLRDCFIKNSDLVQKIGSYTLDCLPLGDWAKLLVKAGLALSEGIPYDLKKSIENIAYQAGWQNKTLEEKLAILNDTVHAFCGSIEKSPPKSVIEYLTSLHHQAREATSQEEAIAEINADLDALKVIMKRAIIRAIGLEKAFISVVTRNIELIRSNTTAAHEKNKFHQWLKLNIQKVKNSEFAALQNEVANHRTRRIIIDEMKKSLAKINA